MLRISRLLGAVVALAAGLAVVPATTLAAGTPDLALTVEAPGESLLGTPVPVTLSAANASGTDGYNLGFSATVPAGATVADTDPAPTRTITLGTGETVLVWDNVADALDGTTVSVSFSYVPGAGTFGLGSAPSITATAVANSNPRLKPRFDADGAPVDGSHTGNDGGSAATVQVPFEITKSEPSLENERIRGVHDGKTVYTIEIENNPALASTGFVVVDFLPAGLEFLGCDTVDNSAPGSEYGDGRRITDTATPPMANPCPTPTSVTTVETDPDGPGGRPFDVYTRVEWDSAALAAGLGSADLAPGASVTFDYVAAIPLRENTFPGAPDSTSNLDNNTGDLTTDEQALVNLASATATAGGSPYTDADEQTTYAEDLLLTKQVDNEVIAQGATSTWTLTAMTSEYAVGTGPITIEDRLPASLDLVSATPAPDSTSILPDGRLLLTWTVPGVGAPGGVTTITLDTTTRTTYRQGDGSAGAPVAANDSWTNTAEIVGTSATIITDNDGSTTVLPVPDSTSAAQTGIGAALDKQVSDPVPGTLTCGDGTGVSWSPDLADGPYRPGDRVCWLLRVEFPAGTDTLAPVVQDFLPDGFAYESHAASAANTVALAGTFTDDAPRLTWDLGDVDAGGEVFEVVVSTVILDARDLSDGDILTNLIKAAYPNSAGEVFQLREQADAPFVAPELAMTKTASASVVQGGDTVTYTVTVTNTGSIDAVQTSVRDLLPTDLACVDVSNPGTAVCSANAGRDWLQWDGVTVPAGDSVVLTYTVLVPDSVVPDQALRNDAGVRSFENDTNTGAPYVHVPENNIDPTLTPNSSRVRTSRTIRVVAAELDKTADTSVDEAGNAAGDEATLGETVSYRIAALVPEGTTVADGQLTDTLPVSGLDAGSVVVTLDGAPLPAGFTVTVADPTITVDFPAAYTNAAGSGDDEIVVTFDVLLDDGAGDGLTAGDVLTNDATFRHDGETLEADVDVTVVEPRLTLAKDHDDADGAVVGGQEPVVFTVEIGNDSGPQVSVAHDVVAVDTVPVGITPLDAIGDPVTDGHVFADGGTWNEGARTITWTVAAIDPGDTVTRTYATRIDDPIPAGADLTNSVTAVASSATGPAAGERDAGSGNPRYTATANSTVTTPSILVTKAADRPTATIGEEVVFTLDVTIPTSLEAWDVTVLDDLPAGLAFESLDAVTCDAGGPCSPDLSATALASAGDTGTVGFFVGDVTGTGADRTVTITYTAYVDGIVGEDPGTADEVTNTVRVHHNLADTIAGTPSATPAAADFDTASAPDTATVDIDEPTLVLDKDVLGQTGDDDLRRATPGTVLDFTVEVTNAGTSDAHDLVIVDFPDPRLTDFTDTGDGVVVDGDPTDGSLSWAVAGPVAPGDSITIGYSLTVPDTLDESAEITAGPELLNTADVTYHARAEADRTATPGRTHPAYDDVDGDTVGIELDLASIGDRLWHDVDGDGVQDPGEPDLSGVTVTVTYLGPDGLPGGGDDEVHVTETDSDGTYLVDELPGGEYTVVVDTTDPDLTALGLAPSWDLDDLGTSPDGAWIGALAEDGAPRDVDFGFVGSGSVGDTVFFDRDGNGALDPGDPGLDGAVVTLVWAGPDGDLDTPGDNVDWTTTTAADGSYRFDDLPAGEFRVAVDPVSIDPSYANVVDPDGSDDHTADLTLAPGGSDLDQDFGYAGSGSIGDTVYLDQDGDGVQDPAEPGLAGVTVRLDVVLPGGETTTLTTTTDADGTYRFDGLPAGDYTVTVTGGLPAAVTNTEDRDGGNDSTVDLSLVSGQVVDDVDFGYDADSVLGDRVWWDVDGDGVQDPGEPGLGGVTVEAVGPNGLTLLTTTDADGDYLFVDLPDGDWTVSVGAGVPAGFAPTYDADDLTVGPDESSEVTLTTENLLQDFGYTGDSSIGDTIWLETDGDGIEGPGEPGLPDVTVSVTWAGPDGDPSTTADNVTFTTVTDADGSYLVDGLPAGTYTVAVDPATLPTGVAPSGDPDGGLDHTAIVTLPAATDLDDVDFGYVGGAAIGDTVWLDLDGDGTIDADEPGLEGIGVTLTWFGPDGIAGTGDDEVFTTTTDDDGTYLVTGLPAGDYDVAVDTADLPAGLTPTHDLDGGLDHRTAVTLADGEVVDMADFGYRGDGAIGDTIWLDRDGDGLLGPDDLGVPAQEVRLTWGGEDGILGTPDDEVFTTTTDPDGSYRFDALPDGPFEVAVVGGIADAATIVADPDGGDDSVAVTTLAGGSVDLDQDFGYRGGNQLGDHVWWDTDADGPYDEPLPGVTLSVTWAGPDGQFDTDDDLVFPSVETDANGDYLVGDLPDGPHRVTVVDGVPAGLAPTTEHPGLAGDTTLDATSVTELGGTVDEDLEQDFGFAGTGSIGDHVWLDLDRDGRLDTGEPGLAGATVTLVWAGPDGNPDTADDNRTWTTTVDGDGTYRFDRLPAGEFSVVVDGVPTSLTPTADPDGGDDLASIVTLAPGGTDLDQDFGVAGGASVGDEIWIDLDGDGFPDDDEPRLPGIPVTVTLAGADGIVGTADDLVVETMTDDDGRWTVDGLPAGPLVVAYDADALPAGVTPSADPDGGDLTVVELELSTGEGRDDVDFGTRGDAILTGTVAVRPVDGATPTPVAGVPIVVTYDGPTGPVVITAVTETDGTWTVPGLPAGDYTVEIDTAALPVGTELVGSPSLEITLEPGDTATVDYLARPIPSVLAFTGGSAGALVGIGVLLLLAGSIAWTVSRRREGPRLA